MEQYRLYENCPAKRFEDAHLLGNGSTGASVYGGVPYEKILINHDTLWSGQEQDKSSPRTLQHFPQARQLVLEGKLKEATDLINNEMLGHWSESFLPMGHLHLVMGHTTDLRPQNQRQILSEDFPFSGYSRVLTLEDAVERIEYQFMGCRHQREIFVSRPDDAVVIRLTAEDKKLSFSLSMDSPLRHEQIITEDGAAVTGRAPDRVEPYAPVFQPETVYREDSLSDSIRFAAAARIIDTDGELRHDDFRVYLQNASYAVILLHAETNYAGFRVKRDRDTGLLLTKCRESIESGAKKGYHNLLRDHVADYQSCYQRFRLDLGEQITAPLPTSKRLQRMGHIDDPSVTALIVQYVRYLLIAFSRPGTQAGHLQGLWNPHTAPSWASNYTTNINVEMNYWAAEALNLADCHEPMLDLIRECAEVGKASARQLYGMPGWVVHHNTDLWRFSDLAGEDASWAWWAFGGFWMCQHLWQHYEYSGDRAFLKDTVYPLLRGAAEFLCAFVAKDEDGYYVTAPSTSPENKFFIGEGGIRNALEEIHAENRISPNRADTAEVCKAATMDLAIIRELLTNLKTTLELLDIRDELEPRLDEVLEHLLPFRISSLGTLQEWDRDFEECTPGMAHVSHLYTVYPSAVITDEQPDLFEAARQSLYRRVQHGGTDFTGWPGAWKISLYARFLDGVQAGRIHAELSKNMGANMLTEGHLQIDAIMGWGAGIAEMLLQSHQGVIRLLPAPAPSWRTGSIRGMRARGGVQVDMDWSGARLHRASLTADRDGLYRLRYGTIQKEVQLTAGKTKDFDGALNEI